MEDEIGSKGVLEKCGGIQYLDSCQPGEAFSPLFT